MRKAIPPGDVRMEAWRPLFNKKKEHISTNSYFTKNTSGEVFDECKPFEHALTSRSAGLGIGASNVDSAFTIEGISVLSTMLKRLLQGCAAAARVPWQIHFSVLWLLGKKEW